ncbi:MAG: TIR domain-containing protein [Defluviicoccus sp.]|nr:TIR domain-containing protein [Defluviicoccus sp.]MDG4592405.1 TIR domain-containing protein [Defluviicoccus sp.]
MSDKIYIELQDVFVLSGVPRYTFVHPVEYPRLLVALRTPGRSIVVEGPSGIGKTTAVVKAIADAGLAERVLSLSARKKEDIDLIAELPSLIPLGTVIVDDFHRLMDTQKQVIADLMKTLADEGSAHSKLVVLGITNAGQGLISFGKDLANRIEIIPFEANPENKVEELVRQGEAVLNVDLNVRDDIVRDAHGSFYIAQMLAYHTCLRASVLRTSVERTVTAESYESVKTVVMTTLARSFHDTTIAFARGTKLRREGRAPYLHLLYWLSQSKNWSINTDREADRHPEQRGSVSQVITKGFLRDMIHYSNDIQRVLHFDQSSHLLVAQDPQFIFYIRNISWPQLADEIGFLSLDFPSRYDFALSFARSDRDVAEGLFSALQENEFEVFYDRNEQHRILAQDVEEYLKPVYASDAQLVVCILGPDYPNRVWTRFESDQFKRRFQSGEVIPIVMSTAPLGVFDSANRVGHLSWDRAEDFEVQLRKIAELLTQKCADVRMAKSRERAERDGAGDARQRG